MCICLWLFFFKQKTAYEMRISDWSSDVCSSDLDDDRAGMIHRQRGCFLVDGHACRLGCSRQPDRVIKRVEMPAFAVEHPAMMGLARNDRADQIGRASCRERVCQYV